MEPVDAAVLATERYGSQETWKYRLKDGMMKRERQGEDNFGRGSSITSVFKVSLAKEYRPCFLTICKFQRNLSCNVTKFWHTCCFSHNPPPTRVFSCLKATLRAWVTIMCSTRSGTLYRCVYWTHHYHTMIGNCSYSCNVGYFFTDHHTGFFQLSFRHLGDSGLLKGCRSGKPRSNCCCCNHYLVTARWVKLHCTTL